MPFEFAPTFLYGATPERMSEEFLTGAADLTAMTSLTSCSRPDVKESSPNSTSLLDPKMAQKASREHTWSSNIWSKFSIWALSHPRRSVFCAWGVRAPCPS